MQSRARDEAGPAGATAPAGDFELFVLSPEGLCDPSLAIAASRAGALGFLNLSYLPDPSAVAPRIERLIRLARGAYGVVLHGRLGEVGSAALDALRGAEAILLTCEAESDLAEAVGRCRAVAPRVGLIVNSEDEARRAACLGFDLVVAKGHEAGGRIGDETTFILLQRLLARVELPVFAWGGVGPCSAAACRVAGAAGVVLDWQLALTRESPLPEKFRRRLAAMDGSETVVIRGPAGRSFRVYWRPGLPARDRLEALAEIPDADTWERAIGAALTDPDPEARLWAVGQDGAFAARWADGAATVARALARFREETRRNVDESLLQETLGPGGPLARSHGTTYPVLQGPMTRVSDVPEFSEAVAEGGGLPFLALALLRGPQVRDLLLRTRDLMGARPWGVGILGFVDRELRAEQAAVIEEVHPPFAIIAGGRPDQAASLEARGTATYLHVPSPGMLEAFIREGSRRFIFEGRECGGHVGPRTSFVLWETMIRVLLEAELTDAEAANVHVVFAGGIHDGLGGAMISALAQPLVRRGMKVGVLLGTAYLFTEEIVRTGAILSGFQEVAIECDHTTLVDSGPGHTVRCADTEFVQAFGRERDRLRGEGRPEGEIREELERMNLGRLRVAAKGIVRVSDPEPGRSPYASVGEAEQRRDGMYMIGQVAALRRGSCTIRALHEEVTAGAVARLRALRAGQVTGVRPAEPAPPPLDIAIVGMACLLPGATSIDELWHNILAKRDLVGEVPAHRFESDRWFDPDRRARDKIYSRWGGFLDEIPFDPHKYGIPPASLRSIEPAQLLALELVDRVLRDAGYADRNPHADRTGVIFGVSGGVADLGAKYILRALLPQFLADPSEALLSQLPEWTEDSFAGILNNVLAGRITNRFDLGGPNFTVDAACASSLTALYAACRELAAHTSDLVIAGGSDTVQNAFGYLCFAKSGALSPRGRSRSFDAGADGIAISEGLAAVALKRREDAERDGDRIYAVIRGLAAGSDGRSKGMTAPRPEGQMRTLRRAYAQAGFSPATVELFEAHGTGTAVGDATECQVLASLLAEHGAARRSLAIGSIKSMIGHTKATAGVAGLIKAALALHHRVLPPTLHVEEPNPKAGLVDGPLYVNTEVRPWLRGEHPRRAAVSSFGFGGTNFHAVLEAYEDEALPRHNDAPRRLWPAELFVFAGETPADLAARVRGFATELREALGAGAELELSDLAYTVHRRPRPSGASHLVAIVSASVDALHDQLTSAAEALEGGPAPSAGIYFHDQPLGRGMPLAFLFPGQGAQFPDMVRDLAVEFPEVAACFENADGALAGRYDRRLSQFVFPPPAFGDRERAGSFEALKATDVAQPALGACGMAMVHLLASFGVRPGMAGGHSYGELVALCAAGSLDEADLYRLSLARGRAMLEAAVAGVTAGPGTMVAAGADRATVLRALEGCEEVWIANHNSTRQVAISGTHRGIARAVASMEAAGIVSTPIPVSCAFHCPIMTPARDRFEPALRAVDFRPASFPVYSNVLASAYPAEAETVRRLLSEQVVHEVRFVEEIESMYADGARIFVELGPSSIVAKLVDQTLGHRPHAAIALQARGRCGVTELLHALAALIAQGVPVDLERLYSCRSVRPLDLRSPDLMAPRQPAPHIWMVDGGEARPLAEPKRPTVPLALVPDGVGNGAPTIRLPLREDREVPSASSAAAARPSTNGSGTANDNCHANGHGTANGHGIAESEPRLHRRHGTATTPGRRAARAANQSATLAGEAEDFAQFQKTMRQFLRSQERVFEAYFNAGSAASAASSGAADAPMLVPEPLAPITVAPDPITSSPQVATAPGVAAAGATPAAALAINPAESREESPATLERLLLEIASERTGYPTEMLGLDANLEAELGIDSIKRVEIIGAFRRAAVPARAEAPGSFMEEMTAARTLRAILQGVERFRGSPKAPSSPPASAPAEDPQAGDSSDSTPGAPRCVGAVVEIPLESGASPDLPDGVLVLTDEGRGIARTIAETIESRGGRARLVGSGELSTRHGTAEAIDRIRQECGRIGGVIHLLPLQEAPPFPGLDEEAWSRYADVEVKGLLYLLQAIAPEMDAAERGTVHVVSVSIGGGDFDAGGELEAMYPWRGGLAGMAKAAAKEWAGVRFRAIDVDEDPDAAQLLRELAAEGPVEIGYRRGRRLTIEAMRQELPDSPPATSAVALTSRSVVLVTGGARGITGEAVRELAERTGATFILLGRSPAPHTEEDPSTAGLDDVRELRRAVLQRMSRGGSAASPRAIEAEVRRLLGAREIRRTLAAVRDAGARAEYISCDVQDARALEGVVREVGGRLGGIDAILHGAGVIEDSLIAAKDPDSFDRVWRTKVLPLVTLARLVDPTRLQLVMLFSSIAGFFGNPGQADYAAANEALNRMARRLAGLWPAKVVAMNWGPWSGAGMVRPEVARQFEDRGVPLVTVQAGRRAVWREILHRGVDDVRVLLGPGPWLAAADRLASDAMSEPSPLLVDQAVYRLPGGVVEARVVLDADRHAYLRDHQIDGQPVLPLTVALELLAEVASAAQPDWHVTRVSNLRMFSGVVLEDRRREVMLRAEPFGRDPRGGEWRVRLTDPSMPARPLYEATVQMAPEPVAPPTPPPADPIDRPPPLVAGEVYRRWLFHGPLFQAIEQLRGLDDRGVDAVVRPSSPRLCLGEHVRRGWLIDPVVLDAAPQVALIWSRAIRGTSALPSRIGTYHRYGPMGDGPLEMIFRVDGSATDAHTIRATAWFVRDGRVVGLMEGLEGAASAQLNRIGADAT